MNQHTLDFYGTVVACSTTNKQLSEWLQFDFDWFLHSNSQTPHITITAEIAAIPTDRIPAVEESMHTPECVCYDSAGVRYVDYYGRALVIYDYEKECGEIYSEDEAFAYEKLYLLILSRSGELLDKKGIHRVHALGFTYQDAGIFCLMPMKGGKTTHALALLRDPEVKLISEDTPLLNRKGEALAFPLRFGILDQVLLQDVPKEFTRNFQRQAREAKTLISVKHFKDQIQQDACRIKYLFTGKWIYSDEPQIRKRGKLKTFFTLMRDCVFGLGLPQLVEYFLQMNTRDLFRKTGIMFRRSWAVFKLTLSARSYTILLSRDINKNVAMLLTFLQDRK